MSAQPAPAVRPGTDIVRGEDLSDAYRVSKAVFLSGRFPAVRKPEEALVQILVGRELGIGPMQAMMSIHVVEGKPMVSATLLASFVQAHTVYGYRVKVLTDEACTIEFTGGGEALGDSTFTIEDAQRAQLVKEKSGWKKYPRNMLFARAMSNGVKWFVPEVLSGLPVYVEGEIIEGMARDGALPEDGVASTAEAAQTLGEAVAALDIPDDLRTAIYGATTQANELAPGSWFPAKVQMVFAGLTEERTAQEVEAIWREVSDLQNFRDLPPADVMPAAEPLTPSPGLAEEAARLDDIAGMDAVSEQEAEEYRAEAARLRAEADRAA